MIKCSEEKTVRRLLISNNEEDIKIAGGILQNNHILRETMYAFEDVEALSKKMRLEEVKYYQKTYPHLVVTGSVGLFLHGVRLSRFENEWSSPDLDFVSPFYIHMVDMSGNTLYNNSPMGSGTSFDFQLTSEGSKIDIKIDPKRTYSLIKYDGFEYKVSNPLEIIEAKIKYWRDGDRQGKHMRDIYDMIGATTFLKYLDKVNNESIQT